ncbi:MAG: hypothetical protein ACOCYF_02600, partial [Bacteroidota bacterium]
MITLKLLLTIILVSVFSLFSYTQKNNQKKDDLICLEFQFGENDEPKIWDGNMRFTGSAEHSRFIYQNSNKGWLDNYTEISMVDSLVSWKGKATHDTAYDWVIYNNKLTEGYSPEKDLNPFKPFRL